MMANELEYLRLGDVRYLLWKALIDRGLICTTIGDISETRPLAVSGADLAHYRDNIEALKEDWVPLSETKRFQKALRANQTAYNILAAKIIRKHHDYIPTSRFKFSDITPIQLNEKA